MQLIKVTSRFQITIPKYLRKYFASKWIALHEKEGVVTLRGVEVMERQTTDKFLDEIMNKDKY